MALIFLLTTLILNTHAASCHLELYPQIITGDVVKASDFTRAIKKSDCPKTIEKKIVENILNYSKKINPNYILSILNLEHAVTISPRQVEVLQLREVIKQRLYNNRNAHISDLKLFSQTQVLGIDSEDSLQIKCSSCTNYGMKNIQILIPSTPPRSVWVKATIQTQINALVALNHLSPSSKSLSSKQFILKPIHTSSPTDYFSDRTKVSHYKINKPIIRGSPLKNSDLTPLFLVSPRIRAEVTYRSKGLRLRGTAIPRERGRHGDTIKLSNPQTGKIIFGKVVGKNKVLVQL